MNGFSILFLRISTKQHSEHREQLSLKIEKPSKLPLSISDVYAKNIAPNIGGGEKGIPSPAMQKDTNL